MFLTRIFFCSLRNSKTITVDDGCHYCQVNILKLYKRVIARLHSLNRLDITMTRLHAV